MEKGNDQFSGKDKSGDNTKSKDGDIGVANITKLDGYVITPSGSIQEYNHTTGVIEDITNEFTDMPSDQADPDHINSTNARSKDLPSNEPTESPSRFSIFINLIFH